MPESIDSGSSLDPITVLNNEELRGYLALDLGLRYSWKMPASLLTIYADLSNVLDRNNVAGLDYDIEEEDDEITFVPNRDTLLPFIPTIGFRLAF